MTTPPVRTESMMPLEEAARRIIAARDFCAKHGRFPDDVGVEVGGLGGFDDWAAAVLQAALDMMSPATRGWSAEYGFDPEIKGDDPGPDGKPYYLRRHDVVIFGQSMHLRAVRVKEVARDGPNGSVWMEQVPVHDPYDLLDGLYKMDEPGEPYTPTELEGFDGEWIIIAVPFC